MSDVITFGSINEATILQGRLKYLMEEHSFDFEANIDHQLTEICGSRGITSISIGTLQLDFSIETKTALYVWGYYPMFTWRETELFPPAYKTGKLLISMDDQPEVGISYRLPQTSEWYTYYDPKSGWICIGDKAHTSCDEAIEFCSNTVTVIRHNLLTAIWLHPTFIES